MKQYDQHLSKYTEKVQKTFSFWNTHLQHRHMMKTALSMLHLLNKNTKRNNINST